MFKFVTQNATSSAHDKQIKTNGPSRCSKYLAEDQRPTDFWLDKRHRLTWLEMLGQRYTMMTLHLVPNMILQSAFVLGSYSLIFPLEKPWNCFLNGSGADWEKKKSDFRNSVLRGSLYREHAWVREKNKIIFQKPKQTKQKGISNAKCNTEKSTHDIYL